MSIDQAADLIASRVVSASTAYPDARVRGTGPLELMVSGVEDLTPRIRRFELRSPRGGVLPPWTPGAHVAVPVALATGSEMRCYSLMGDCELRDVYEIAVLRNEEGRGGSMFVHDGYREGMRLRCAYPSNSFELIPNRGPCALIAGGVGITPLRAMAIALERRGTPFVLHYATRSPRETAFMQDLGDRFGTRVQFWHSAGDCPSRLDVAGILRAVPITANVYVCGPPGLIREVTDTAVGLGMPRANVRYELFSSAGPAACDHAFEVLLARSHTRVQVSADETILDAVLAAGVPAEFGCRAGQCGACAVTALEGDVDHRDTTLSDDERIVGRRACICVSRAKGARLVLDL